MVLKYFCKPCRFVTRKKTDFNRHCITQKHQKKVDIDINNNNNHELIQVNKKGMILAKCRENDKNVQKYEKNDKNVQKYEKNDKNVQKYEKCVENVKKCEENVHKNIIKNDNLHSRCNTCIMCEKSFYNTFSLKRHLKRCTPERAKKILSRGRISNDDYSDNSSGNGSHYDSDCDSIIDDISTDTYNDTDTDTGTDTDIKIETETGIDTDTEIPDLSSIPIENTSELAAKIENVRLKTLIHAQKQAYIDSLTKRDIKYKNTIVTQKLKHEKSMRKQEVFALYKEKEVYRKEMEYYKKALDSAGGMVKKSIGALSYVAKNYDDAPEIKCISFEEVRKIKDNQYRKQAEENDQDVLTDVDEIDEKIIDEMFHAYKHNNIGKYIGDIIIEIYKKEDPHEQSVWSTDTSRLTYLLKKVVYDDTSKWIVDKKGVETMNYLITPVVKKIRELAVDFQERNCFDQRYIKMNQISQSKIMLINDIFNDFTIDIDNNKVHNAILKYISAHLAFSDQSKNIKA